MEALKYLSIIYLSCIDHSQWFMNKVNIYNKIQKYILLQYKYFEDNHGIIFFSMNNLEDIF